VYAERRIIEATLGREEAELQAAVGRRELLRVLDELAQHPELTRLRGHLDGIDPDHAFSIVPYEKGYLLLRALEENEGRERWDTFLRRYMQEFRFQALTTEEWLAFLERELPGAAVRASADLYLHGHGLPDSAPRPRSERLDRIVALPPRVPAAEEGARLSPLEWMLYLERMPRPVPLAALVELDQRFVLTRTRNADILCAWLSLALESHYEPAQRRALEFLGEVGRLKYLKPLYRLLLEDPASAGAARQAFARYREGYHPIARHVVESLMQASNG
jgi:aminopeptidase N